MGLKDCNPDDADDKLKQYMLINKQISKTLTNQRVEIANLKKMLRTSTSEIINLQMESFNWKQKFHAIRKMYIDHIQSITSELQTNAEKINSISGDIVGANDDTIISNSLLNRSAAGTTNTSKGADDSRRVSKSFESTKNRSEKSNVNFLDMDTIEEENENESSEEASAEMNEESGVESSTEVTALSESGVNDSNSTSVEKSVNNSQQDSIEEDSDSDSEDENYTDSEEDGDSDEHDDSSNEGSEKSEQSSKNGEETSKEEQNEDTSDADSNSESVEQISLLTTNYESTMKNDDSNKENDRHSTVDASAQSIDESSQTVISVDGEHFNKSTSVKSLPKNKNVLKNSVKNTHRESINNQTFGSMQVNSLVSSTPYRNNNNNNDPVKITTSSPALSTRSRLSTSNAVISMTSQVSITSGATSSSTISVTSHSSRPRRKASPAVLSLSEPKLNTKLRRPR